MLRWIDRNGPFTRCSWISADRPRRRVPSGLDETEPGKILQRRVATVELGTEPPCGRIDERVGEMQSEFEAVVRRR